MDTRFLLMARYDALPTVRTEPSQKSQKGVHVEDLADFLDARRAESRREYQQMFG